MSDFESFQPGESGESYDPAAFERFKDAIKKSAAAQAAAQKSEQKQKQKEDKLAKILLKFIQTNQKSSLLLLAAMLMKENIPPSFILSIILLGNDEVQEQIKREIQEELQLAPGSSDEKNVGESRPSPTSEFSLVTRFSSEALPLRAKAEIDAWGKGMFEAASAVPFKIFETVVRADGSLKSVVVDCCANVLGDYLKSQELPEMGYETYFSFCEFLVRNIIMQLKKQVENQKELN